MKVVRAVTLCALLCAGFTTGCAGDSDPKSDAIVLDVTPDITTCPDNLVLWEEYNICAPRVDDCENPWELPIIGGGCMAIGPRGCPKLWDPEADVDCEPGELMTYDGSACPEGFVLTDDEVACIPFFAEDGVCGEMEIPVLGGGCKKVGPEWYDPDLPYGGLDMPHFDECPEGLLALEGGGCIQIGPRACPKLWDPDTDVDCEIGDVLPCPVGWSESDDGMYCDPGYAECPTGERALIGGACERVIPLAEDCPPGPFPEVPDGATNVVYVLAESACIENCGSEVAPFPSIQAAIDAVPDGGHVLVGAGTYDAGLLLPKSAHVAGLCAAKVAVSGQVAVNVSPESPTYQAGVAVVGAETVTISGLRIDSPEVGMVMVNATGVVAYDIEVAGSVGAAVIVSGVGEIELYSVWIHDTVPPALPEFKVSGLRVDMGAQLHLEQSLIESVSRSGVWVRDPGAKVRIGSTTIRTTDCDDEGVGHAAVASSGAQLVVTASLLEKNCGSGIILDDGASAKINKCVVRETWPNQDGQYGIGLGANSGTYAELLDSIVQGSSYASVWAGGPGTEIELQRTVVTGTKPDSDGDFGHGLQVASAAVATVSACLLGDNTKAGAVAADPGTVVDIFGTNIRRTNPTADGQGGPGVWVFANGRANLSDCLVEGNANVGVLVQESGSRVEQFGTVTRGTEPGTDGKYGYGLQATGAAVAKLEGSLLEDNRGLGAFVGDLGTQAQFLGTVIRTTMPNPNGTQGAGLKVKAGAIAELSDCVVEKNKGGGIRVEEEGTHVVLDDSTITDTELDENGAGGVGLLVNLGASATVSDCLIDGNASGGIFIAQPGSHADISGTTLTHTKPGREPGGDHAAGLAMQVSGGASATMHGCLARGNSVGGIVVAGSGTSADLSDLVIGDTLPGEDGEFGLGLEVSGGASALMSRCLVSANSLVGIGVVGTTTQFELSKTVVRGTQPDVSEGSGWGMAVSNGAVAAIFDCLFAGNTQVGIGTQYQDSATTIVRTTIMDTMPDLVATDSGGLQVGPFAVASVVGCALLGNTSAGATVSQSSSRIDIAHTVVAESAPDINGEDGMGMLAFGGALASVTRSLFRGNATSGVAAFHAGTSVTLDTVAVLDTHTAGSWLGGGESFQVFGDGVVGAEGGGVDVSDCVVNGNARAGLYYHESAGKVENSVVAGNSSYGLAMSNCFDDVDHTDNGNFIFGNALGLPEGVSKQVAKDPGGMPAPPVPGSRLPRPE